MTDPRSAYIHRSWLVDGDGAQSENVNKVAIYYWDTIGLAWTKATGGAVPGANVNVTNFPATYSVLQGTVPWSDNIAQYGGVATSLGQKAMTASMPMVVASDQTAIPNTPIDHYGVQCYFAPNGEHTSVPLYKLCGDSFGGDVLDPAMWTATLGTGGTATTNTGQLELSTGTTANNSTSVVSVTTARFSGLAPNKVRIPLSIPDGGTANNIRRWGMSTTIATTDGAFFEINGTTLNLVTRKTGVDTIRATNGGFNGQYGATFTVGTTSHFYEVIWQPRQVVWLADNKIIHTFNAAAAPWSDTLHFPIYLENTNTNGSTTNVVLQARLATAARFGIPEMEKKGTFISGTTAATIIKHDIGNLHDLTMGAVGNNARIILYDNIAASGRVLFDTGAMPTFTTPTSLSLGGVHFNIGLTLVISGSSSNVLIIWD